MPLSSGQRVTAVDGSRLLQTGLEVVRKPRPKARGVNGSIDGRTLHAVMEAATRAIEANCDAINALNVFPVPDGDTGTNMLLTMRSALADTRSGVTGHAGRDVTALARATLLGARGNSGLILAQFFKGLSSGLSDSPVMGAQELARGLRRATDNAYASVPEPKEGTMLTVFRECAERAEKEAAGGAALQAAWESVAAQALDTVSRTPSMLRVLRDAGVVDSGGYGFAVMLEGGLQALTGIGDGAVVFAVPEARVNGGVLSGHVSREFAAAAKEEVWGYCTSFAVLGKALDPAAVRVTIAALGRSSVVAGDETVVKVHVHVLDPGVPLSYGASIGTLSNIEIMNMDEQAAEQARVWGGEARPETEKVAVAVVAVVAGGGMAELFRSTGLGLCSIVEGGDTMNPSTADLLKAVEAARSDSVLILPNNKNVIGTAGQVPGLTQKHVRVVPTRSMQAGVSALLALSPESALDENAAAMGAAAKDVVAVAVCKSTRDVKMNGRKVSEGDYIGIVGDDIIAAAHGSQEALLASLDRRVTAGSVVTVYYGAGISKAEAEAAAEKLRSSHPGAEVELVEGGQPHYEYLAAVE